MIILPIKKKWFDLIASGHKKQEYREIKPYYNSRFRKHVISQEPFDCILRNGYSCKSPQIKITTKCSVETGNPDWGATPGNLYYVLDILSFQLLPT